MSRLEGRFLIGVSLLLGAIAFSGCSDDEEGVAGVPPSPPPAPSAPADSPANPPAEPAPGAAPADPQGGSAEAVAPAGGADAASPAPAPDAPVEAAIPNAPAGPRPEECVAALESMVAFTSKMGQERPGTEERREFLSQCEEWPKESVACLIAAKEPPAVVTCMKPIAELEMRKARQAVRKKAVEEQSKILGEEARKRAEAIEAVKDSAKDSQKAAAGAPSP